MNVGFISLGCSKNLVDTEMAIGIFKNNEYCIVNSPQESDIIVINTCGFIESAKEEAINTILEMAEYKKKRCKYLIVMGCLVERYKEELQKALPEVDLFLKIKEYENFWEKITKLIGTKLVKNDNLYELDFFNRTITTGGNMAYLKIAEGCSNRCTYCAIPYIRGPFVSRPFEDIIEEAKSLAKKGYREIIVIAQDTTKYGIDLYGKPRLAELLDTLAKIENFKWIRFLYAYPETITDELIDVVKNNNKICNYFDIPIQHISNTVLKRMNRKSDTKSIETVINKIREKIPNVILRTTVIVGFPGETKEDFNQLYKFIEKTKFDKLGVFKYSKEEGTPAEKLKDQIHHSTKKSRYKKIMELQNKISQEKMREKIGNIYDVLIETKTFDGKFYIARSYMDTPDIDGLIYIKDNNNENLLDKFVKCEITDIKNEYDLIGKIVN